MEGYIKNTSSIQEVFFTKNYYLCGKWLITINNQAFVAIRNWFVYLPEV